MARKAVTLDSLNRVHTIVFPKWKSRGSIIHLQSSRPLTYISSVSILRTEQAGSPEGKEMSRAYMQFTAFSSTYHPRARIGCRSWHPIDPPSVSSDSLRQSAVISSIQVRTISTFDRDILRLFLLRNSPSLITQTSIQSPPLQPRLVILISHHESTRRSTKAECSPPTIRSFHQARRARPSSAACSPTEVGDFVGDGADDVEHHVVDEEEGPGSDSHDAEEKLWWKSQHVPSGEGE